MRRWITTPVIFLLGFGVSQLISFFSYRQPPKPVEITQEATATAVLGEANAEETATVVRVVDGDTLELSGGRKLRYIGIDTPETMDPRRPIQCFGVEAKNENARLVEGKTVVLEKDISETDRYARLLRYVYVDGVMVNDTLVRQGFAYASSYPPDIKYQQRLQEAEQEAQENNRGLWAGCNETMEQLNNEANAAGQSSCTIKGNISSGGEKIYHVPGCGSYEKTSIDVGRGEQWFCDESEAVAAGWRKAKNCP